MFTTTCTKGRFLRILLCATILAQACPGFTQTTEPEKNAVSAAASTFQMRLVLDAPTSDTEDLPLENPRVPHGKSALLHVEQKAQLDQTSVKSVMSSIGYDGSPEIQIVFTEEGAKRLEEITTQNIHKRMALVIASKVYMAPVIHSKIPGGKLTIVGAFTQEEAKDLVGQIAKSIGQKEQPPAVKP